MFSVKSLGANCPIPLLSPVCVSYTFLKNALDCGGPLGNPTSPSFNPKSFFNTMSKLSPALASISGTIFA